MEKDLVCDYAELAQRCDNPFIYLIAHSRAGAEFNVAARGMTSTMKEALSIITLGSAKLIEEVGFRGAINYINENDIVPRCDFLNYYGTNEGLNVVYTGYKGGSFPQNCINDHFLDSQGYQGALREITRHILGHHGT